MALHEIEPDIERIISKHISSLLTFQPREVLVNNIAPEPVYLLVESKDSLKIREYHLESRFWCSWLSEPFGNSTEGSPTQLDLFYWCCNCCYVGWGYLRFCSDESCFLVLLFGKIRLSISFIIFHI